MAKKCKKRQDLALKKTSIDSFGKAPNPSIIIKYCQ